MPKFHSRLVGFTFSKHFERIQKFKETGNLKIFYRNELGKTCLAHDAVYSDSKDLAKRTISDKVLKDKAYEIARNCTYDWYQRALASMVYKYFDKKTESGVSVNETQLELKNYINQKLKNAWQMLLLDMSGLNF